MTKYLDVTGLQQVWQAVKTYVTNAISALAEVYSPLGHNHTIAEITDLKDATSTARGLLTAADKGKLDGIDANAQVNTLEGVKVNGTALDIAEKMVNILIASGSANGTLSVNGVDIAVKGLAALAYKAEISEAELSAALKAVINAKAEQTQVDTLSGKIDTLNGTGAGSVSKAITDAFNDFATKVTDDGVVNSYKELIDWAASHGSEATEMTAAIQALQGLLDGIGGADEPATVVAAINAATGPLTSSEISGVCQ